MGTLSDKLNHTAECKESIREAVNQNLGGGAELISPSTQFDQYADYILPSLFFQVKINDQGLSEAEIENNKLTKAGPTYTTYTFENLEKYNAVIL